MKYYAVKVGKRTGIFHDWDEVKNLVIGYPGAKHKSFKTEQAAIEYLSKSDLECENVQESCAVKPLIAYTRGCYNKHHKDLTSYAVVLIAPDSEEPITLTDIVKPNKEIKDGNSYGEMFGVLKTLEFARNHAFTHVAIHHSHDGMKGWFHNGTWNVKCEDAKHYRNQTQAYAELKVEFIRSDDTLHKDRKDYAKKLAIECYERYVDDEMDTLNGSVTRRQLKEQDRLTLESYSFLQETVPNEVISNVVFITGKAGTGKTTLIKELKSKLNNAVVLAPTGIAAINIEGQTIHSYFNFPIEYIDADAIDQQYVYQYNLTKLFYLTTLIIDEVSMVRSDMMDRIDKVLRVAKRNQLPFGGVKVLLFGDLFQLPPVMKNDKDQDEHVEMIGKRENDAKQTNYSNLYDIIMDKYHGIYFFNAPVFKQNNLLIIELTKVYRQSDRAFIDVLGKIRDGTVTEQDLKIFGTRVAKPQMKQKVITVTPYNKVVSRINHKELDNISNQAFEYEGRVTTYEEGYVPRDLPNERKVVLKPGARVMTLMNDRDQKFANGTIGTISKIVRNRYQYSYDGNIKRVHENVPDGVYVLIPDLGFNGLREVFVTDHTWSYFKYIYDRKTKKIEAKTIAEYHQIPLRLAWAITIHKSQGLTFEHIQIDYSIRPFETGQTYVAISRCRSLEGLYLSRNLTVNDVMVNTEVFTYLSACKEKGFYVEVDDA
jgi:ATP-dependent DNA helicase PIF1